MDPATRAQRRRASLQKKRNEKYGPPVPTTPEEIKAQAMMTLKTAILKHLTDFLSMGNAAAENVITNNKGDLAFFKLGELLEEFDRQLKDDSSPVLDFNPLVRDLYGIGLLKEGELEHDDLIVKKEEWSWVLSLLRAFFLDEVATFLNVYHDYY